MKRLKAPPCLPIDEDPRICFSIAYFATEEDANRYAQWVREMGFTYNGGFFHGMACGRSPSWDRVIDGKKQFAVTQ